MPIFFQVHIHSHPFIPLSFPAFVSTLDQAASTRACQGITTSRHMATLSDQTTMSVCKEHAYNAHLYFSTHSLLPICPPLFPILSVPKNKEAVGTRQVSTTDCHMTTRNSQAITIIHQATTIISTSHCCQLSFVSHLAGN